MALPISTSPSFSLPLPFIDLEAQRQKISTEIDKAILRVIHHGMYIMGPEVFELEKQLSEFSSVPHVLGVANGTDALFMGLMALGVGPGDAIFVPTLTFAATAEVVALTGATPVFIDADERSFNMSIQSLSEAIEFIKKEKKLTPKGIIPVCVFGNPAPYDEINEVAQLEGLWVMADIAQSFGARYKDKSTASQGILAATSFFPAKPLGAYGDAGAIFTHDAGLAETLKSIRIHGQGKDKYENVRLGITGRLDTIQAAILIEKLKLFSQELTQRQKVAAIYTQNLSDICITPYIEPYSYSSWAQYTILVNKRDQIASILKEAGIPTMTHYSHPLHTQQAYRNYPKAPRGLPTAEQLSHKIMNLPMHPYLSSPAQSYIIDALRKAFQKIRS